jgi:hypothetical protein
MEFSGLASTTLYALCGGTTLLTLLLYALKLRRRSLLVAFSPIWQRVLSSQTTTRLFSNLKRWLSWLVQWLLGLGVVFAWGDPKFSVEPAELRHVVVLVDVSASMKATDEVPSRLELGKQKLVQLIAELGDKDELLLAELSRTPRALTPLSKDKSLALAALQQLQARDTGTDLERSLQFARDALYGAAHPEVWIVSDALMPGTGSDSGAKLSETEGDTLAPQIRRINVGAKAENLAITAFSARRYPLDATHHEVLVEVTNFGHDAQQAELTLLSAGEAIHVSQLQLAAGARISKSFPDLAASGARLTARIKASGPDYLAADNEAYALLPERKAARVLLVTPGNTYLEAALLLDVLDVTVVTPKEALPSGPFDVTILDGCAPALSKQHGAALYLAPPEEGSPVKYASRVTDFGFDKWEKTEPLLRWITPENIQVARGQVFSLAGTKAKAKDVHVVGQSEQGPLLITGSFQERPFVATSFDPRDSDWVLRVGWPLFLQNTFGYFSRANVEYTSSLRCGETWSVSLQQAGAATQVARVRSPSGREFSVYDIPSPTNSGAVSAAGSSATARVVPELETLSWVGEEAGFYTLHDALGGVLGTLAGNLFDDNESRLDAPAAGKAEASSVSTKPSRSGAEAALWRALVWFALFVSVLEWFTYHRRITV